MGLLSTIKSIIVVSVGEGRRILLKKQIHTIFLIPIASLCKI